VEKLKFNWDPEKEKQNRKKHGISFIEASWVFYDPNAVYMDDKEHSENEERFYIIGKSNNKRLLLVCHCYRDNESVIRIISARKVTTAKERNLYYGGKQ